MFIELRMTEANYQMMTAHLIQRHGCEEIGLLLAGVFQNEDKMVLTVREWIPVPGKGLQTREKFYLQIDPEFLAPVVKKCRYEKASLLVVHSHPMSNTHVGFSGIDDAGEDALIPKIQSRVPDRPHGALVVGKRAIAGRVWLANQSASVPIDIVRKVGEHIHYIKTTNGSYHREKPITLEMHERQVLAIGKDIQDVIYSSKVAVVGLGGLGTHICVQLLHAGVTNLLVIDDDIVEESNRSRIIDSRPEDSTNARSKIDVIKRYANDVVPSVIISSLKKSIEDIDAQKMIRGADVIFCCTDNLASRAVLNRISYQYLIPMIDIGMDLQYDEKQIDFIRAAGGRMMLIQPDGPCLECMGLITGELLDMESGRRPCGNGVLAGRRKAPSAIFLNGVIASLGVTRLMDIFGGWQRDRQHNTYEMFIPFIGIVKTYSMDPMVKCTMCKEIRGYGDDLSLPGRISPTEDEHNEETSR